jgi:rhodanese-related sulfurtransferase
MTSITPQQFVQQGSGTLIDVREPDELAEVRTEQAVPMPMSTFLEHLGDLPEGPLFILCRSGARSGRVTAYLRENGYDATNVEGGIIAWEQAGLPVVRG